MQSLVSLTLLFTSLLTLTTSSPTPVPAPAADNSAVSPQYYLRTYVSPTEPHEARFNNLYLESYHTGAGLGDAVLTSNRSDSFPGFINGTYQQFLVPEGNTAHPYPWGMFMPTTMQYSEWEPVQINVGYGAAHGSFFLNATGLQWSSSGTVPPVYNEFAGWLVCEWSHGVPQLFWKVSGLKEVRPASCADVDLVPEYV